MVDVPATRYTIIQPDAPPNLTGAIYSRDGSTFAVGDMVPIPRNTGLVFWKVLAVERHPDATWTGVIRFGYVPEDEWPPVSPEDVASIRKARRDDFPQWSLDS